MFQRVSFSQTVIKSALALHLSMLALSACNGNQPMPLFNSPESLAQNAKNQGAATQTQGGGSTSSAQTAADGTAATTGNPTHGNGSDNNDTSGPKFERQIPVFDVVGHGISRSQADSLARSFNLRELKLEGDGSVSYLDEARFQNLPLTSVPQEFNEFKTQAVMTHVPTTLKTPIPLPQASQKPELQTIPNPIRTPYPKSTDNPFDFSHEDQEKVVAEYLDFEAIKQIKVMPEEVALDKILIGLRQAGLLPQGKPIVGHSEFESRAVSGGESLKVQLDTQVGFEQTLGALKIMGPGAKVKVAVDGEGVITQLRYAGRTLRQGGNVDIMPPADAEAQALKMLNQDTSTGKWEVSSELVYYAPPLDQRVKSILPHYLITAELRGGNQQLTSRMMMVPAVQSGLKIQLKLDQQNGRMQAGASVSGGTAPYRYSWSSANGQLDTAFGDKPQVDYALSGRMRSDKETLYLTVTDANGLTSNAEISRPVDASQIKMLDSNAFKTMASGRYDAGTEWVGLSQGLGGSRDNAHGFVNGFRNRGTPVEFNFGDYAAWEEDFKKVSMGGNDNNYTDNVDMVFYTGHANGNLFTFPGMRDDGALEYTDGSYGERELEWLMVAACGPMQMNEGGVHLFDRWGRVFKGLHMLAGYANVSLDNTIEGDRLARFLLAENRTVRSSWALMAAEAQPSTVTYGYMGVIGPGGMSNWNDHYWGKGAVGPDIHDVRGYWAVHAPS